MPAKTLSRAVVRAYRRFYLRPRVFRETLTNVRGLDDVKKYLLTAANLFNFMVKGE